MFGLTGMFGVVAGVFSFSFYLFYIIAILRGNTKPSRTSWWIWSFIGIMITVSYFASGARDTIWVPVGESLGPFIIAILALKYGEKGTTRLDSACLVGAFIGIVLWWMFSSPFIALMAFIFSDFMGAIPTIKKSYLDPSGESGLAWFFSFLGSFLNLFAVNQWGFSIGTYPIYVVLTNTIIVLFILRKRFKN